MDSLWEAASALGQDSGRCWPRPERWPFVSLGTRATPAGTQRPAPRWGMIMLLSRLPPASSLLKIAAVTHLLCRLRGPAQGAPRWVGPPAGRALGPSLRAPHCRGGLLHQPRPTQCPVPVHTLPFLPCWGAPWLATARMCGTLLKACGVGPDEAPQGAQADPEAGAGVWASFPDALRDSGTVAGD